MKTFLRVNVWAKQFIHNTWLCSPRAQKTLRGVVALRYQHHDNYGGVDKEVPQLHATLSEPLD